MSFGCALKILTMLAVFIERGLFPISSVLKMLCTQPMYKSIQQDAYIKADAPNAWNDAPVPTKLHITQRPCLPLSLCDPPPPPARPPAYTTAPGTAPPRWHFTFHCEAASFFQ